MIYDFEKDPICIQLFQTPLSTEKNINAIDDLNKKSFFHDIWAYKKILQCVWLVCIYKYHTIQWKFFRPDYNISIEN